MRGCQIILTQLVFLAGCQPWWEQQLAPAAPPMGAPYAMTASPPLLPPGAVVVPAAPQMVSVYPHEVVVPGAVVAPQAVPGPPMFGTPTMSPPGSVAGPALGGAPYGPAAEIDPVTGMPMTAPGTAPMVAGPPLGPNPVSVPVTNEEFAWDQIADVVSDYFTIAREQRARRDGEVWTEGRIETAPLDGATWLEPWRKDSVGSFNRWESTFQTIRRRAIVRVIPDASGYLVEVIVEKELEDLPRPQDATAGGAVFLDNGSLPSRRLEEVARTRSSPLWLSLGRDPPLEQQMLREIQARFGVAGAPVPVVP